MAGRYDFRNAFTYRVHDWQRCKVRDGPLSHIKEFMRAGVYRDGIGRLRCLRCMSYIHRRKGEMPLRAPTVERKRQK